MAPNPEWHKTIMSQLADDRPIATPTARIQELNKKITEAVGYSNENVANFASKEAVVPYDIMVSQSAGQISQAAAQYMDGVMQVTLAGQSVLTKKLVEDVVAGKDVDAAKDGAGITYLKSLMRMALAVGAGIGVIEGDSASKAMSLMDTQLTGEDSDTAKMPEETQDPVDNEKKSPENNNKTTLEKSLKNLFSGKNNPKS